MENIRWCVAFPDFNKLWETDRNPSTMMNFPLVSEYRTKEEAIEDTIKKRKYMLAVPFENVEGRRECNWRYITEHEILVEERQ